jgi:hypothetical protein
MGFPFSTADDLMGKKALLSLRFLHKGAINIALLGNS